MELTVVIPDYNLSWLQDKIDKLNKKAKKLNCLPITLEVIETTTKKNKDNSVDVFLTVVINGESPKLNGWVFIGKLENIGDENLILGVPGFEIPVEFRTTPIKCNHCNSDRYRKYTYLVQNENTILQVGSQCLKDFLGHTNPQVYANWAESLMNLEEEIHDALNNKPHNERNLDIQAYLEYVVENIKKFGWVSKTKAQTMYGVQPTAYSVLAEMFPENYIPRYTPSKESKQFAEEALQWIRETEVNKNNTYLCNLQILCGLDYIKFKDLGFVASLIITYQKHLEQEVKNNYYGDVGDKVDVDVTLLYSRYISSYYGVTTVLTFISDSGYKLIWFASGEKEYTNGQRFNLTGRIKKLEEYNNHKQTILTRCKLNEIRD